MPARVEDLVAEQRAAAQVSHERVLRELTTLDPRRPLDRGRLRRLRVEASRAGDRRLVAIVERRLEVASVERVVERRRAPWVGVSADYGGQGLDAVDAAWLATLPATGDLDDAQLVTLARLEANVAERLTRLANVAGDEARAERARLARDRRLVVERLDPARARWEREERAERLRSELEVLVPAGEPRRPAPEVRVDGELAEWVGERVAASSAELTLEEATARARSTIVDAIRAQDAAVADRVDRVRAELADLEGDER